MVDEILSKLNFHPGLFLQTVPKLHSTKHSGSYINKVFGIVMNVKL